MSHHFSQQTSSLLLICRSDVICMFAVNSGDGMIKKDGEMVDARAELEKLEAEHAAQKNVRIFLMLIV